MCSIDEWHDIGVVKGVDFTGMYKVSRNGEVMSLERYVTYCRNGVIVKTRVPEKLLLPSTDKDGYLKVSLSGREGIRITVFVHRLVAMAFIKNPNNYPVVNHKNQVKNDNRVENLEWCTVQYNSTYADVRERVANTKHTTMSRKVAQMDLDGNIVKIWQGPYFASQYGYNKCGISACIHGRLKTYKGYLWKWADELVSVN